MGEWVLTPSAEPISGSSPIRRGSAQESQEIVQRRIAPVLGAVRYASLLIKYDVIIVIKENL